MVPPWPTTRSSVTILVDVGHSKPAGGGAGRHDGACTEAAAAVVEEDRDAVKVAALDGQIRVPVLVEVARRDGERDARCRSGKQDRARYREVAGTVAAHDPQAVAMRRQHCSRQRAKSSLPSPSKSAMEMPRIGPLASLMIGLVVKCPAPSFRSTRMPVPACEEATRSFVPLPSRSMLTSEKTLPAASESTSGSRTPAPCTLSTPLSPAPRCCWRAPDQAESPRPSRSSCAHRPRLPRRSR